MRKKTKKKKIFVRMDKKNIIGVIKNFCITTIIGQEFQKDS